MRAPAGYRDLSLAGAGATSRVYRAVDARTGHAVALKRLHRQLLEKKDGLARLKRELDALGRLRHPGLVAVRDVMRWDGDPTVVMDFVPGEDLDQRIAREGPVDVDFGVALARALFDLLSAAHAAGIVHRDVKPQNVRLAEDGRVYLLDFGSARFDASSALTATGTSVGTPDYMAPELFAGSVYDPRVDVYGVGATLFKALTGQAPHTADSLTELAFRRTKEAAPPVRSLRSEVPAALAQVVDRCLERAPEDRYPSCALALWALEHPDAERSFRARRRSHPPCLHCGAAIAPTSALCPRCGSDHPFAYTPGSHHVVVHNVKRPERFARALLARFPERSTEPHLRHIAQRIGALEHDSQRLLSFVDEREARQLADALEAEGAQCEVVADQGTTGWRLYGLGIGLFLLAFVAFGHFVLGADVGWHHAALLALPTVGALLLERLLAVAQASQGILSSGRYPAALVPNLRAALGFASGGLFGGAVLAPVAGAALEAAGASAAGAALSALTLPLVVGGGAAAVAGLVAWRARFGQPILPAGASAEPGVRAKLARALSAPKGLARGRLRAETAVLLTTSVLALVPVEMAALDALSAAVQAGAAKVVAAPSAPAAFSPAPVEPAPGPDGPGFTAPVVAPEAPTVAPDAPVLPSPEAVRPPVELPPTWALGLSALFALFGLGAIGYVLRRQRRVAEEAAALAPQLAARALGDGRAAPARRLPERLGVADGLALVPGRDAFEVAARARAADLAHVLDRDATDRLRGALERLAAGAPRRPVQGLLASAIGDADPEQRLRFELLALEGELEASAAQAWWERIVEKTS